MPNSFINIKNENTLKYSTSPYLKEHAENPVFWHEWNAETLKLAKELDRPLIISIGYAACHWCHVMADQSFSDQGVAEIMNTHFICIKIDREERPDLDQIYMNACQMVNGSGGWPLNAFALHDGKPFYAGTFFPKHKWINLLTQIRNLYKTDKDKLIEQAENITQNIRSYDVIPLKGDKTDFSRQNFLKSFNQWYQYVDLINGGTKGAPKFPLPSGWLFLLDYYCFTKENQALQMVEKTLDSMAFGGIFDQIGGGFARYSVDEYWLVPHFEKMLYDNAQLINLYSIAYKITKNELYREIVEKTISFINRELASPGGGYFSSLNADSEKVEGKFYVWNYEEFYKIVEADEAELFSEFYNITSEGNWEDGKNILHYKMSYEAFAKQHHIELEDFIIRKNKVDELLFSIRNLRIRPETDIKILTSWNSLLISGLVSAYSALDNEEYLKIAIKTANFLWDNMRNSGCEIMRNISDGKVSISGFLEDYAHLAEAFIALYESTFEIEYLKRAQEITNYVITHFKTDTSSMFYYTSDLSDSLVARKMELSDNVIPSSNSVMAIVLYRLGVLTENSDYIQLASKMLSLVVNDIDNGGPYYANWGRLFGLFANDKREVIITGKGYKAALREIQKKHMPQNSYAGGDFENMKLLNGRVNNEKLQIFVCTNQVCGLPFSSANDFENSVK